MDLFARPSAAAVRCERRREGRERSTRIGRIKAQCGLSRQSRGVTFFSFSSPILPLFNAQRLFPTSAAKVALNRIGLSVHQGEKRDGSDFPLSSFSFSSHFFLVNYFFFFFNSVFFHSSPGEKARGKAGTFLATRIIFLGRLSALLISGFLLLLPVGPFSASLGACEPPIAAVYIYIYINTHKYVYAVHTYTSLYTYVYAIHTYIHTFICQLRFAFFFFVSLRFPLTRPLFNVRPA